MLKDKPFLTNTETGGTIKDTLGNQNSERAILMRKVINSHRAIWESQGHKLVIPSNLDVDTVCIKCSECPAFIVVSVIDGIISEPPSAYMYYPCPIAPKECPWCNARYSVIGNGGWQFDSTRGICTCHDCGHTVLLNGEYNPLSNHVNHVHYLAARDPAHRALILLVGVQDNAETIIAKMRYHAKQGEVVIPCFRPEDNY